VGGLRWRALPGSLASRHIFRTGFSAHFLFIIPSLDLVIVHRTDNEPPEKDAKTIEEMANRGSITEDRAQFGHLMKLILDAQTGH
jgi:hypothetical protein